MSANTEILSQSPVKSRLLKFKIDSKKHIEAWRLDPKEGIENENSITFVIKRLMPIEDKWLVENGGGHISKIVKFGYFIWKNQIKISKESLSFMAYASEILL